MKSRRTLTMENDPGYKNGVRKQILTMENDPGPLHPLEILTMAGVRGERFLKNAPYKINIQNIPLATNSIVTTTAAVQASVAAATNALVPQNSDVYITHCGLSTQVEDFSGIIFSNYKYRNFSRQENNKIRAFLDTISFCEGTFHEQGYNAYFNVNFKQQQRFVKEFYYLWNNDEAGFKNDPDPAIRAKYKNSYAKPLHKFPHQFKDEYFYKKKAPTYHNIINFLNNEVTRCATFFRRNETFPRVRRCQRGPTHV